jgi:hypothetical protein
MEDVGCRRTRRAPSPDVVPDHRAHRCAPADRCRSGPGGEHPQRAPGLRSGPRKFDGVRARATVGSNKAESRELIGPVDTQWVPGSAIHDELLIEAAGTLWVSSADRPVWHRGSRQKDRPCQGIALCGHPLCQWDRDGKRQERREPRQPLAFLLQCPAGPIPTGELHDHVVAKPIERVVRPERPDQFDRTIRPLRELRGKQLTAERWSKTLIAVTFPSWSRPKCRRSRVRTVPENMRTYAIFSPAGPRSGWPGVSIRLTVTSPMTNDTTADLIVMPRCRSSGKESVWLVPSSTLPIVSMTPAAWRSRSVRLVLPASTCARIPKFKIRIEGHILYVAR